MAVGRVKVHASFFMFLPLIISVIVGYLLGSLPFGYLVARSKGVNIFEVGSKNPGATNVRRVLGAGPGNLVFFLDALKGAAAAGWALLAHTAFSLDLEPAWLVVDGSNRRHGLDSAGVAGLISALLGHSFSCFTNSGRKGVATVPADS